MNHSIRSSDVFVKADLAAMLMALQVTAARYPQDDFHAGFLAALTAFRAMLNIPVTLADIDALPELPSAVVHTMRPERRQLR